MRKIVLMMMTTLNGRLDDPGAWISGISSDLLAENARLFQTFDTILIGEVTYHEMVAFWPNAEHDKAEPPEITEIAKKMNAYKKYILSKTQAKETLDWANAEQVQLSTDEELSKFVRGLKAEEGRDVIVTGGARLAQAMIRLNLVDEYYFNVYPIVSPGWSWFDKLPAQTEFKLLDVHTFENGAVRLHLIPSSSQTDKGWWDPTHESK